MNPPLLEVNLNVHFSQLDFSPDRLAYFEKQNSHWKRLERKGEDPGVVWFSGPDEHELLLLSAEQLQIKSTGGVSYPRLRPGWMRLVNSLSDAFELCTTRQISLSYLNEIPIDDLRSFRNYLNISFDMPVSLKERIEFFRSEFTYSYPFGEIHVWLQPDWDDQLENYCIQLSMESRMSGAVACRDLEGALQQLHEGIKDVFHQVMAEDYIRQLPQ